MAFSIEQISTALNMPSAGDVSLMVAGVAEPSMAGPDTLALAMSEDYADGLAGGHAKAAILWDGADWQALGLSAAIFAPRPRYAMSGITKLFDAGPTIDPGIHPSAIIHPTAQIGAGASIGPFVVVEAHVTIGPNARIAAHTSIAEGAEIGADALLLAGSKIGARVRIGDRLITQPGAVVGADGFSFTTPETAATETARRTLEGNVEAKEQSWARIHSLGAVVIGDDVEVGANSTIDRGTVRDTRIGSGTKIDNLVQIGHNVEIGRDCLLCGQSGVAGSAVLGDRVVVGGAASIADHLKIGSDVVIAGKSGVASNVPAGRAVMGYPAMPLDRNVEAYKALRRLPRLFAQVAKLQATLKDKA